MIKLTASPAVKMGRPVPSPADSMAARIAPKPVPAMMSKKMDILSIKITGFDLIVNCW